MTFQWLLVDEMEFGYLTRVHVTLIDEISVEGKGVEQRKVGQRTV